MIEDGLAEAGEIEMFEEETTKVLEFLQSDDPYSCTVGSCRNTDYSSGIPLSLDTDMGNVKLGKNPPFRKKKLLIFEYLQRKFTE